jgi:DNA/RNA endonuclease G (NUC1)
MPARSPADAFSMNKAAARIRHSGPSRGRASAIITIIVAALLVIVGAAAIILKERSGAWWSPVLPPLGALALLVLGALLRKPGEPLGAAVAELVDLPRRNPRLGFVTAVIVVIAAVAVSVLARAEVNRPDGEYWVQVYEGDNIEGQRVQGMAVVLERETRPGIAPQVLRKMTDANGSAAFPVSLNDTISLRLERNDGAEYYPVDPADVVTAEKLVSPQLINLATFDAKSWKRARTRLHDRGSDRDDGVVAILQTDTQFFRWIEGLPQQQPIGSEALQSAVAPFGVPPAEIVIRRQAYTVGFSPYLRLPRWVAYRVLPGPAVRRSLDRFGPDPLIPRGVQASSEDYRNNPFDFGHLVRRIDVAQTEDLARSVFLLSVVTPQTDMFNRKVWSAVEQFASQLAHAQGHQTYVMRGPIFLAAPEGGELKVRVIGTGRLPVPTHFFQIVLDISGNLRRMHCFVVPNEFLYNDLPASSEAIPDRYRARLDVIESGTGLRFFPQLQRATAPGC